jgi:hypothetical protein
LHAVVWSPAVISPDFVDRRLAGLRRTTIRVVSLDFVEKSIFLKEVTITDLIVNMEVLATEEWVAT